MTLSRAPRPDPRTGRTTVHGSRHRGLVVLLALVVAATATGCGLRLQTPPPAPLVPDEVEVVRQRATADAVALEVLATSAAGHTTDATVAALLGTVTDVCEQHLVALGGIYEPTPEATAATAPATAAPDGTVPEDAPDGTVPEDAVTDDTVPGAAPTPDPSPSPAQADAVDPAAVVALLVETAASAQADAAAVPDGPLARLLASVATARMLVADALRVAAGLPLDGLDPALTAPFEVPDTVPGVPATALVTLVQSEDAIGMAWEIAAARTADDPRAYAEQRAEQHRERAQHWAELGAVQGTGLDPRRSSYALPAALTATASDPAAVTTALADLEVQLAQSYASLVAAADPDGRSALVDALRDASRASTRLTGVIPAFPGLPEHAA
ncbi:DUF4439 domain-containing protein [Cellulomonas sp. KRMCY2]|uniref:DUF4439 domain-containing protein n=1 Tax=Cellulomonas sp. KRMCY2 TaxID=1304865 RepID=UPI0004AD863B|nr:DUF4439 domain-containing protein [Cellulomonas sp. KRMCY2]